MIGPQGEPHLSGKEIFFKQSFFSAQTQKIMGPPAKAIFGLKFARNGAPNANSLNIGACRNAHSYPEQSEMFGIIQCLFSNWAGAWSPVFKNSTGFASKGQLAGTRNLRSFEKREDPFGNKGHADTFGAPLPPPARAPAIREPRQSLVRMHAQRPFGLSNRLRAAQACGHLFLTWHESTRTYLFALTFTVLLQTSNVIHVQPELVLFKFSGVDQRQCHDQFSFVNMRSSRVSALTHVHKELFNISTFSAVWCSDSHRPTFSSRLCLGHRHQRGASHWVLQAGTAGTRLR